jgi:hypothetical protein
MGHLEKNDYVLVSGFAQTPKGTPLNEMYKHIGVQLLVDRKSNRIIKSDFSVISSLTKEVLQDLVQGYCIDEPFGNLENKIKKHMSIPSLGAVLQAIKSAIDRYKDTFKVQ